MPLHQNAYVGGVAMQPSICRACTSCAARADAFKEVMVAYRPVTVTCYTQVHLADVLSDGCLCIAHALSLQCMHFYHAVSMLTGSYDCAI